MNVEYDGYLTNCQKQVFSFVAFYIFLFNQIEVSIASNK